MLPGAYIQFIDCKLTPYSSEFLDSVKCNYLVDEDYETASISVAGNFLEGSTTKLWNWVGEKIKSWKARPWAEEAPVVEPTPPAAPRISLEQQLRADITAADNEWAALDLDVLSGARRVLAEHAKTLADMEKALSDMQNPSMSMRFGSNNGTQIDQAEYQEVVRRERAAYNAALAPAEQQLRQEQLEKNVLFMRKRSLIEQFCQHIARPWVDYQKTPEDIRDCKPRP